MAGGAHPHAGYPAPPHSATVTPSGAGGPRVGVLKSGSRSVGQSVPRRAYVLFCRQERPVLVQANPHWDLPTVNKELGRKWKELTAEQKEAYHDLERKEAELRASQGGAPHATPSRHSHGSDPYGARDASDASGAGFRRSGSYADSTQYTPTGPAGSRALGAGSALTRASGKSGALGSGNPNKGPSKAYVFYSRMNRRTVTSEHPDWDLATVNRALGRMWQALSLDERQSWEGRAGSGAAGGPTDSESSTTTPHQRASPAAPAHAAAAALQAAGENGTASAPATPASEVQTPTPKDDAMCVSPRDLGDDADGIAEDVDMQDDDTEDDEARVGKDRTPSDSTTYA
ncbi:hypothetical protein IWQ57_006021, partial [Coemansia nantahalensis]